MTTNDTVAERTDTQRSSNRSTDDDAVRSDDRTRAETVVATTDTLSSSRRSFVRAAGAGVAALGFGSTTASADDHDADLESETHLLWTRYGSFQGERSETVTGELRTRQVPAEIARIDLVLDLEQVEAYEGDTAARITDVAGRNGLSVAEVDGLEESGTETVDVRLEGSLEPSDSSAEILDVTLDLLAVGEAALVFDDVQFHYASTEEPVEMEPADASLYIDHPDPVDAPSGIDLRQVGPNSIEVTWEEVEAAASYEVYVDEEPVSEVAGHAAVLSNLETDREMTIGVTSITPDQHRTDTPTEQTFEPLDRRDLPMWIDTDWVGAEVGDRVSATFELSDAPWLLDAFEFTLELEQAPYVEDRTPVGELADLTEHEHAAAVSTSTVYERPNGRRAIDVVVEDWSHPAGDRSGRFLTVEFDTFEPGDVILHVTDPQTEFQYSVEPVAYADHDRSLSVGLPALTSPPDVVRARQAGPSEIEIAWSELAGAEWYEVLTEGDTVARVEDASTEVTDFDVDQRQRFDVQAFNAEDSTWTESVTYVPLAEQTHHLQFVAAEQTVEYGETVTAHALLHAAAPAIRDVDCSIGIESTADGEPAVEVVDVTPSSAFESATVDVQELGSEVALTLEEATLEGENAPIELATVELEAIDVGEVDLVVAEGTLAYDGGEDPLSVVGASSTVTVDPVDAPEAPSTVSVEERTTDAVDLSWTRRADAEEYGVYVAPFDLPERRYDDSDPLAGRPEEALVERTTDLEATVDGLDSLTNYRVGVTAISTHDNESPVTSVPVQTADADDTSPTVAVEFDATDVEAGDSLEASLVVEDAPTELLGYVVHVRVDDPSVATIGSFEAAAPFDDLERVRLRDTDDEWVTVEGIDAHGSFQGGDAELGTVTIDTHAAGPVEVVPFVEALSTDGEGFPPGGGRPATLDVDVENWEGSMAFDGKTYEPNDANGDGLYRDVTGSGEVTAKDLQVFFANQHTDVVQNHERLFDFTGSGGASQLDVIQLFRDV